MPSYSPVFSSAFILYTPSTPNLSYEVPAGYTAVVRQISMAQEIGATLMWVTIQNDADVPFVTIAQDYEYGAFESWLVEGRWVCPGGGIISAHVTDLGTELSAYVGGYLLRNTLT